MSDITDSSKRAAFWVGYAVARGRITELERMFSDRLQKDYPDEWEEGHECGWYDDREKNPDPCIGFSANPQEAYQGRVICNFRFDDLIGYSFYIEDNDLVYADLANHYWRWQERQWPGENPRVTRGWETFNPRA